jgi:hypothetical protein
VTCSCSSSNEKDPLYEPDEPRGGEAAGDPVEASLGFNYLVSTHVGLFVLVAAFIWFSRSRTFPLQPLSSNRGLTR